MIQILKFLKSNWISILLSLLLLGVSYYIGSSKISRLNSQIEELQGNYNAYVNLYNGELSANNLLRASEHELKISKDSLISELGKYIEENRKLKKLKTPQIVQGITQEIHDTVIIEVPVSLPEFDVTKKLNEETIIRVQGKDTLLSVIPDISNTIKVEIGVNRVYKNTYKNGWVRFWHFDWKKIDSYEYTLDQSNDLIVLTDVKIVKIE